MNYETLAKRIGVHLKTFERWLQGKSVYLRNIDAMAKVLETSVTVLTGEDQLASLIDDPKVLSSSSINREQYHGTPVHELARNSITASTVSRNNQSLTGHDAKGTLATRKNRLIGFTLSGEIDQFDPVVLSKLQDDFRNRIQEFIDQIPRGMTVYCELLNATPANSVCIVLRADEQAHFAILSAFFSRRLQDLGAYEIRIVVNSPMIIHMGVCLVLNRLSVQRMSLDVAPGATEVFQAWSEYASFRVERYPVEEGLSLLRVSSTFSPSEIRGQDRYFNGRTRQNFPATIEINETRPRMVPIPLEYGALNTCRINEVVRLKQFSVIDLASRMRCSPQIIDTILRGTQKFSTREFAVDLSEILDVLPYDIYLGKLNSRPLAAPQIPTPDIFGSLKISITITLATPFVLIERSSVFRELLDLLRKFLSNSRDFDVSQVAPDELGNSKVDLQVTPEEKDRIIQLLRDDRLKNLGVTSVKVQSA